MTPLARGYAQALLESAPAGFDIGRFLEGARAVARAVEIDPRLKAFFAAPGIAAGVKAKTLEELARLGGLDDFGRRFLGVVLSHRRILHLAEILSGVSEAHDAREGVVAARVTVAASIGEPERRRLEQALAKRVGRKVRMQLDVDPETLAGFVARVGSNMFDASAASEIERFRGRGREKAGD
ncbi:MAG: ATP synthase F1 subunit delta [Thermoanaerobaculia bacterium]